MSKPKFQANGGIYHLTFEQEQIVIRLDRLREDTKYNLSAEITIRTTVPGHSHLHQARLNLTSTSSRRTVTRFLKERLDHLDWDQIIEMACVLVIDHYREGEPAIPISAIEVPEHVKYRLEPLMLENQNTLLYGFGGLGKSYISAYLATLIEQGYPTTGFMPEPGPVLYLDYEASKEETARRFDAIHRGLDLSGRSEVMYRFCFQPLASEIQEIQKLVVDHGIQVVVIDSAGPACGGEPESPGPTISYFTALRSLRITSLTIAHKSKTASGTGPFGSVYWTNYPRSIFEVKAAQEAGSDFFDVALVHKKANNGHIMKAFGLRFTFQSDPERVFISRQRVVDIPELEGEASVADRLTAILGKFGRMTVPQLAEETDIPAASIRSSLNRGRDKRFLKFADDAWGALTNDSS